MLLCYGALIIVVLGGVLSISPEWLNPGLWWFCGICTSVRCRHSLTYSCESYSQGVSFSDGKRLPPFKIIYILLGGLAIIVGICVLIWLPDSPVHARILTREERIAALERVRDDQGGTENKTIKKDQIMEALLDIRTWLIVLTTMLSRFFRYDIMEFS